MKKINLIALLLLPALLMFLTGCGNSDDIQLYKRYCKAAELVADSSLVKDYNDLLNDERWHTVVQNWKEFGVKDVQIYQFKTYLLMIIETEQEFNLHEMESQLSKQPDIKTWEELSKNYFQQSPNNVSYNSWQLIDRVYKLDQQKDYNASEGYVEKRLSVKTKRLCEMRRLVDDTEQIEQYKYHHALGRAWPEITEGLKNAGIIDMEIYMTGSRTFKIYDVIMDFDIKTSFEKTRTSRSKEWGALVGKSDRPFVDENSERISQFMERIY